MCSDSVPLWHAIAGGPAVPVCYRPSRILSHFHFAFLVFSFNQTLAHVLNSLARVSRREGCAISSLEPWQHPLDPAESTAMPRFMPQSALRTASTARAAINWAPLRTRCAHTFSARSLTHRRPVLTLLGPHECSSALRLPPKHAAQRTVT